MKTVFIFGAGASAHAGAPLMSNFLDMAEDLLRQRDSSIEGLTEDFERVFSVLAKLRAAVHEKSYLDLENIEAVFGAVEMAEILQEVPGIGKGEYASIRTSLIRLIAGTLEASISFPTEQKGEFRWLRPPTTYGQFIERLTQRRLPQDRSSVDSCELSFITFNYDICLDFAITKAGLVPDYRLTTTDDGSKPRNSVSLLKLHGSLNWFESEDDSAIVPVMLGDTVLQQDGRMACFDSEQQRICMGKYARMERYQKMKLSLTPSIVPPAWSKGEYHRTISNVWASAARDLSQAENIIIIGYSLPETDTFFRYLFSLGCIGPTRIRNLIVVNPDGSGATEQRFRSLIGRGIERRFRYLSARFDDAVREIVGVLRPDTPY